MTTSRRPCIVMALLAVVLVPAAVANAQGNARDEVDALLRHATTSYGLAQATESGLAHLERAQRFLVDAAARAAALPAEEQEPLLAAARVGLAESEYRLHNARLLLRNRVPILYQLVGQPAAYRDGRDPRITAFDLTWPLLARWLESPSRYTLPAIIRCRGATDYCGRVREQAQTSLARTNLARPVLDEMIVGWGARLELYGFGAEAPDVSVRDALRTGLGATDVLLVDVEIVDELTIPERVARLELGLRRWDPNSGSVALLGTTTGVGVLVRDEGGLGAMACVAAFLLAIVSASLARVHARKPHSAALAIVACAAGLVGASQAHLVSRPFLPDLTTNTDGFSLWLVVHGGVVFLLPLLLILVAPVILRTRSQLLGNVRWAALVAPAELGACAGLAVGVRLTGSEPAWPLVVGLAVGAFGLGLVIMRPLTDLFDHRTRLHWRTIVPLMLAGLGLVALLPVAAMTSPLVATGISALVAVTALALPSLGDRARRLISPSPGEIATTMPMLDGAHYAAPDYVSAGGRDVEEILRDLESRPGLHLVEVVGEPGSGKSRYVQKLFEQMKLKGRWTVGRTVGRVDKDALAVGAPYCVLADLLRDVVDVDELRRRLALQGEIAVAASKLGDALRSVPGVGLLLGMVEPSSMQAMTAQRLERDVLEQLVAESIAKEAGLLLAVDDWHLADQESVALLKRLLIALADQAKTVGVSVVLLVAQPLDKDPLPRLHDAQPRKVILEKLGVAEVKELLVKAGAFPVTEPVAQWFAGRAQQPGDVLDVLRALVDGGVARVVGAAVELPPPAALEAAGISIPADHIDRHKARLLRLSNEQRLVLEMAAQCGRRFTSKEIVLGLGMPQMAVLAHLRDIESAHGVIVDLVDDDAFLFETETVRRALLEMTVKRDPHARETARYIELVRTFHEHAARALLKAVTNAQPSSDVENLATHCLMAGSRMNVEAASCAVQAAERAVGHCVWPNAKRWVDVARKVSGVLSEDLRARLDYCESRALSGAGGRENRERARALLLHLVDEGSAGVGETMVASSYLENLYREKARPDLLLLVDEAQRLLQRTWCDPLTAPTVRFYQSLAAARVASAGAQPETNEQLAALGVELRGLPPRKERDLLLARVLQEQAGVLMYGPGAISERALIEALVGESLALKETHGDLEGMAISKGTLASYHLFTTKEYGVAEALLQEDLDLVHRMGDRGAEPSLLNRLGRVALGQAQQAPSAERGPLLARALTSSRESLRIALRLEQWSDAGHAAVAILEVAVERRDATGVDEAMAVRERNDIWGALPSQVANDFERHRTRLTRELASAGLPSGSGTG